MGSGPHMLQSVSSSKKITVTPHGRRRNSPGKGYYLEVLISERKYPRLMQEYEEKRQNV